MITKHLKYIQATLSSRLYEFAYKRIFSSIELGATAYQYNKHALLKLPILKEPMKWEHSDEYFYKLYNLSQDEINEIEGYFED